MPALHGLIEDGFRRRDDVAEKLFQVVLDPTIELIAALFVHHPLPWRLEAGIVDDMNLVKTQRTLPVLPRQKLPRRELKLSQIKVECKRNSAPL